MTIFVTGANGFVGRRLCNRLESNQISVSIAQRQSPKESSIVGSSRRIFVSDVGPDSDWKRALTDVECVLHLAARVHVMTDKSSDPLAEYYRVNVEGSANLARQAAVAGVKRFVYLSSVKVNGEFTKTGQPFTADDVPSPEDPYGVSKYEAEQLLKQIAIETGMEVVIIRPPLVYGPGVKANFESMMRWVARGVPLPLAAVTENRRSLVALDNLVDLIVTCLSHPAAANQTFLVSDGEDLSTADLLKRVGVALGHPAYLFRMPPALLKLGATLVNKPGIYQRLCGSLQLDITKTRQLLDWTPPVTVDEGLRRAAETFRA